VRFFYDCEFIEDGTTIDLVSIGVVGEDGREFYAVSTEFDGGRAGAWVRANVLPKLPSPRRSGLAVARSAAGRPAAFLTGAPATSSCGRGSPRTTTSRCASSGVRCPRCRVALPRFTRELRQRWEDAGQPPLPPPTADAHDALADARLNRLRWEAIEAGGSGSVTSGVQVKMLTPARADQQADDDEHDAPDAADAG
jgi:hypothetical protein